MLRPPVHLDDVNPSDRFGDRVARLWGSGDRLPAWVGPLVRALSFWGALALPVVYLPLLAVGIHGASDLLAFLGLFGLHVLALIAGRSYRQGGRR